MISPFSEVGLPRFHLNRYFTIVIVTSIRLRNIIGLFHSDHTQKKLAYMLLGLSFQIGNLEIGMKTAVVVGVTDN